ncbi:AAA family ATPase [Sulfuricurvum sp.]|uniref:AAA family ATPase n=1 Tax=Sulfuricurvum sp. TaxID=2025608 RepID=UPI002624C766|nr:AAA family ATPase [Sulfuricurvum sp.]MDD2781483.1 AAA family ATPase [Sulfuricurvum sp.]
MKLALMSIRPEYAFKILFEQKKFEYRKVSLSDDVSHVVIYATAPIQRIIGIASVKRILKGSPHRIWENTKKEGGVVRSFYRDYFKGKKYAYAIELEKIIPLNNWLVPNTLFPNFVPPQSFKYISDTYLEILLTEEKEKKNQVIFMGGIHGVGKSTLCKKLQNDFNILSMTASQLIKEVSEKEEGKNKFVKNIDTNQHKLIKQIKKYTLDGYFILDGHFTLLDKKRNIKKIEANVFRQMNLHLMILIDLEPEIIVNRLKQRDNIVYDIDLIRQMRDEEILHAKSISQELGIPLYIIESNKYENLKEIFSSIIST